MEHIGTFTGKMNMDINDALMPKEDYTYALNFTNNDKEVSNIGGGGRINSSTTIINSYKDTGDIVIGRANYMKGNGEIVFIKGTTAIKDKILYVAYNDDSYTSARVKLLLQTDTLNFQETIDAKCYDDIVIFTDDVNEPRIIDIAKIVNYNIQTEDSNKVLYRFSELNGVTYLADDDALEYFIYKDKVYKFTLVQGTADFTIVPPPNSHYTIIRDYNDNTYYDVTNSDITLIATPPVKPATVSYTYDENIKTNNIYGNLFAITYRYIYVDGRKSVWSPYGKLSFPVGQSTEDGYMIDTAYNGININVFSGEFNLGRNLKGIDVAVKNLSDNTFKLIKTLRVDDGDEISRGSIFTFYNNESYFQLDTKDTLRLLDYVPYKGENIEILSDGRIIFGDLYEGYKGLNTEILLELTNDTTGMGTATIPIVETTGTYDTVPCHIYEIQAALSYQVGMKANIDFTYTVDGTSYSDSVSVIGGGTFEGTSNEKFTDFLRQVSYEVRNKMITNVSFLLDKSTIYGQDKFSILYDDRTNAMFLNSGDVPMYIFATFDSYTTNPKLYNSIIVADSIGITGLDRGGIPSSKTITLVLDSIEFLEAGDVELKTIKSNSTTELGIKYFDDNLRPFTVIPLDSVKSDFLDLDTINSTNLDVKRQFIKATISNLPPSNAAYYSFVAMKNTTYIDYIQVPAYNYDSGTSASGSPDYASIRLQTVVLDWQKDNDNVIISPWIFEKGDRIRKIADGNSSATPYNDFTYIDGFDVEILKQEAFSDSISESAIFFDKNVTLATGDLVEIYRPRKSLEDKNNEIYYEIGGINKIMGGYHTGNVQTQTSSLPAIIDIDYGNAIIRKRVTSSHVSATNTFSYYVEDRRFSDYYKSEFDGYGRPGIVLDVIEDQSTMLRFGGQLQPETSNNFIARFDYEDYTVLPKMYGSINGIRVVGETLIVFQDTKVTSFYMNKTSLQEANDGTQTVLIDKVLNNKNVSEFDYGCINSESIVKRDTHVLFFDAINGKFARHSKNGLIDISAYGISEYSKELGIAVIEGVIKLKGVYNERNDYFYWLIDFTPLTIPPFISPEDKAILEAKNVHWKSLFEVGDNRLAIVFDNGNNAWKGFMEMNNATANAEMIGSVGSYMTTYVEGQPYIFDNVSFGKTLDVYRETVVEKVINESPLERKIFNYLGVNAQSDWKPKEIGDVKTSSNQESRIRYMKPKEGQFYNDIKRNMLFPNGTYRANENLGEVLRGTSCSIRLRLDAPTTDVECVQSTITSIKVGVTLSEKI